jgi:hypothetical protein
VPYSLTVPAWFLARGFTPRRGAAETGHRAPPTGTCWWRRSRERTRFTLRSRS